VSIVARRNGASARAGSNLRDYLSPPPLVAVLRGITADEVRTGAAAYANAFRTLLQR